MMNPTAKALVLCNEIADSPGGSRQKNLHGAGLNKIDSKGPFPIKHTFWAYIEMTNQQSKGNVQLALMRADSGRRHFFREIPVAFSDPLKSVGLGIRLFNCIFPIPGVYFLELWYNGIWLLDQRLEVVQREGE